MIYILSRTTKKHQKTLSRLLHSQLKKFKDFSRTSPRIQGLSKTVQTLEWLRTLYEVLQDEHTIKITIIFSMILSERHGDLYGRAGDPRCHIWESWPVCVNDRK